MFGQSQDQFRTGLAALAPGYQYGAQAFMSPQVSPFSQVNVGQPTNMADLAYKQYAADVNARGGLLGGIAGLGGAILSAPMTGGTSLAGLGLSALGKRFGA